MYKPFQRIRSYHVNLIFLIGEENNAVYVVTQASQQKYLSSFAVVITFGTTDWTASFADSSTEVFKPASMHFHWGATDNTGSEHHLDGVTYALEVSF